MPTYTCRTEGMSLGRSYAKALRHKKENRGHQVVERYVVESQILLPNPFDRSTDYPAED